MTQRHANAIAFAARFMEHVTPRLRRLAIAEARCIAANVETWRGAHQALWDYARKYGASEMESDHLTELDHWIGDTLLDAIDWVEKGGE